jgi:hypothetical protein
VRDLVTTALDTLGLLLVAAGAAAGAYRVIGWAGLAVGGVVVLAGSWWFARPPKRKDGAA